MAGLLQDKIALVTGAAMGNGEGIARVMVAKGATVILADKNEKVFETAASLGRLPPPTRWTCPSMTRWPRWRSRSWPSSAGWTFWSTTPASPG